MNSPPTCGYPVLSYRILEFQGDPSLVGVSLSTSEGERVVMVTHDILEDLASSFARQAASMRRALSN